MAIETEPQTPMVDLGPQAKLVQTALSFPDGSPEREAWITYLGDFGFDFGPAAIGEGNLPNISLNSDERLDTEGPKYFVGANGAIRMLLTREQILDLSERYKQAGDQVRASFLIYGLHGKVGKDTELISGIFAVDEQARPGEFLGASEVVTERHFLGLRWKKRVIVS